MNYKIIHVVSFWILFGFTANNINAQENQHNTLTQQEKDGGWELLFDGQSVDKWRGYNMEELPDEAWKVEDNVLAFYPVVEEGWAGLDIITVDQYKDFDLRLEWKIEKESNSGIFHHAIEQPDIEIYWSGPEMQVLNSSSAGSLYDLIPSDPSTVKPGEWNTVRILSDGPHIEYWLNGVKVVEFERWTAEWYAMIRDSKFLGQPSFGAAPKGHIGLQDHPGWAKFRNLKIKRLN